MSKQISLTQGQFAVVDDIDFEYLSRFKWRTWKSSSSKLYAIGWIKKNGQWINAKMHRFILGETNPKIQIDHKDGNGLNNQRYNLRKCTNQQNQHNRSKYKRNTSGFKGVSAPGTSHPKWSAHIRFNGKLIHLGYFNSAKEAAVVYDAAARKYHRSFASINFPRVQ